MRLWTLHPRHLDAKGLVALWREALLAQRVLEGRTRGYKSHPQLQRFRDAADPLAAIGCFLAGVHTEAVARGYSFDRTRILSQRSHPQITATRGQLLFEARHLAAKLRTRHPASLETLGAGRPQAHPVFRIVAGPVEPWERAASGAPDRSP
jgi:pyrimidine dimer DNA glycosylase